MFRLSCPSFLSMLSCPGCPGPAVMFLLSYSGRPLLSVLSRLNCQADLCCQTCPSCPVPAVCCLSAAQQESLPPVLKSRVPSAKQKCSHQLCWSIFRLSGKNIEKHHVQN
jgi:hypothetical protein